MSDRREAMRQQREPWVRAARDMDLMAAFGQAAPGAALRRQGAEMVGACPHCGGRDRFAIHAGRRQWHCRGAGGGNDALSLYMHCAPEVPFLEAVAALTGEGDPAREMTAPSAEERARRQAERARRAEAHRAAEAQREQGAADYRAREQERARSLFAAAVPWPGTPVEAYLRHRRLLDDAVLAALRPLRLRYLLHSYLEREEDAAGRATYVDCGRYPAMVAGLVRDGALVGVHLTYLDPAFATGGPPATVKGKAVVVHPTTGEVLPAKKMRGSSKGCCIRLFGPPAPALLVRGEGIETTVGFLAGLVRAGRLPPALAAWAAGSLDTLGGPHAGMVAHPCLKTPKGRPLRVKGPVPRPADAAHPVMAIPDSVTRMIDLADSDGDRFTVEQVLARSAARWTRPGRLVTAAWPPAGTDWAQAAGGV